MNFIEMIGFVISLLALSVLAIKRALEERRRRADPEEYEREEQEQAERLKAFLKSIDMDMQEEPKPKISTRPAAAKPRPKQPQQQPKPQRPLGNIGKLSSPIEARKLDVKVESRKLKPSIENHYDIPKDAANATARHHLNEKEAYAIKRSGNSNRALTILSRLKSRQDMIVYQEIISPPKALR